MALFELKSPAPFPKYKISNNFRDVNISQLIEQKGVFRPRGMNEPWAAFENREEKALQKVEDVFFGELVSKNVHFDFSEMPPEYDDYQWMKHSELQIYRAGETLRLSYSFSLDGNSRQNRICLCTSCFEKDLIWSLFSIEKTLSEMMLNARAYISNQVASNHIVCDFWLNRTGMKGRTRLIESTPLGESLMVMLCEEFPYPGEYDVCLPDGHIIGAICWKGDFRQEEYERVYKKFDIDGYLRIVEASLKEVIPHGTPNGRPRKALAKIEITYECVKPIEPYQVPVSYLQKCANTIRVLAKVDYNRKLALIAGERPDRFSSFSEIFKGNGRINNANFECEFLTRQPLKNFKLDDISLNPLELEDFWEIFCSAYHCVELNSIGYDKESCGGLKGGQFLHHRLRNLSFEIEVEEAFNPLGIHFFTPFLTIYRNKKSV